MAKFCTSCGNPMAEGARFCTSCGAAVPGQPAPPASPATPVQAAPVQAGSQPAAPAPAYAPPAVPAPGGNAVVKILFGVLAVIVFLGLLAAGSCFYVAYRAKQKATRFKAEMGANQTPYRGRRDPCAKLSAGEARAALGQAITSIEQRGNACVYHFGAGKEIPVEYTWEGGAMAFKLSHDAMRVVSGMETFTPLSGLGDEAYLEPMASGLMMRKGDVMVNIDMRVADLNADAAKAMAAGIASHL
jgi:hypothetical protein